MKFKLILAILILISSSTLMEIDPKIYGHTEFTGCTDDILAEEEIDISSFWLSEMHPPLTLKQINHYVGVGIKDNQRTVIYNNDGKITTNYFKGEENVYDLVIICPDNFADILEILKQHKERYGIKTIVATLSEIYENTYFNGNGRDDAERIKYFIKTCVEEWGIKYVLLVGNIYLLPIREVAYIWQSDIRLSHFLVPTDLYYADLYRYENGNIVFSTWDTNENGIFGEDYQDGIGDNDIIDLYPDIYLGRLACESRLVVSNVVKKIINYETKAYGQGWFKRIILVGGDTFPERGVLEGELMNEVVANVMDDFNPYRLWYSLGNLNAIKVEKALKKGAGFLYYSGHGFPHGWATHTSNGAWIGRYYTPYIAALFNNNRLPVIFLDACSTAKLDFNSSDLKENYGIPTFFDTPLPCFAWYFVRHPYGGGIATVGSTRVAYTVVNKDGPSYGAGYLAQQFFESYRETDILGEVFALAQGKYAEKNSGDKLTLQEFILLGDPTLKIGGYQ
jgi:hypothetical protein